MSEGLWHRCDKCPAVCNTHAELLAHVCEPKTTSLPYSEDEQDWQDFMRCFASIPKRIKDLEAELSTLHGIANSAVQWARHYRDQAEKLSLVHAAEKSEDDLCERCGRAVDGIFCDRCHKSFALGSDGHALGPRPTEQSGGAGEWCVEPEDWKALNYLYAVASLCAEGRHDGNPIDAEMVKHGGRVVRGLFAERRNRE